MAAIVARGREQSRHRPKLESVLMFACRILLISTVFVTGCVPMQDSYGVPPQHAALTAPEPMAERGIVSAADPRASTFFVNDVKALEGHWCWTGQKPELRFRLADVSIRRAVVNFTIHEITFKDTGPLRMNFLVNGRLLETVRYDTPGEKIFEKPVPRGWLQPDSDNMLSFVIENPWIASSDGVKLGVLLQRAGFVN